VHNEQKSFESQKKNDEEFKEKKRKRDQEKPAKQTYRQREDTSEIGKLTMTATRKRRMEEKAAATPPSCSTMKAVNR
jgi:hypothetical protein